MNNTWHYYLTWNVALQCLAWHWVNSPYGVLSCMYSPISGAQIILSNPYFTSNSLISAKLKVDNHPLTLSLPIPIDDFLAMETEDEFIEWKLTHAINF